MSTRAAISSRERILNAAADLIYSQGYTATAVDQIVERSGLSKPTLYAHFPSKESLAVAYLQRRRQRELATLRGALATYATPEERFVGLILAVREAIETSNYRGCGFMNIILELANPTHPIVQEARIYVDTVRALIQELVHDLAASHPRYAHWDAERIADLYYLLIGGALAGCQEYRAMWPIDRAILEVRALLEPSTP